MKTKTIRWGVRLGAVLLFTLLMIFACVGCAMTPASETTPAPGTSAGAAATEPTGFDGGDAPVRMASGATVSLASPTGMRFSGVVNKDYLDALKDAYGADRVKVGMLVTPTRNLTENRLYFTVESLDTCDAITGTKYTKNEITPVFDSTENAYRVDYVLPIPQQSDYGLAYSAVIYVEVNGKILRYSAYTEAKNSRSLSAAAETDLLDLSDTKTGKYQNAVRVFDKTRYSAYTQAEREQLSQMLAPGDATSVRTVSGASVSLSSPVGIKFTGQVDKQYLDLLYVAYGADRVKVGMLFTPTQNLTANGLAFTAEALDACTAVTGTKYVKAEPSVTFDATDNTYRVSHVYPISQQSDYSRAYSAVTYVAVNGEILRYSAYTGANNSRSLSGLAETELLNLSSSKTGKYQYTLCVYDKTKYSPYTPAQRELLTQFCYADAFTVMSYNIEVYDKDGVGWEGRTPAKVMETVKNVSPDIIGFQEVNQKTSDGWDAYLANLATEGGYTRLTGEYCAYDFEKNEIFFKSNKFTKVSEGTLSFKQAATNLNVPNTESANNKLDKVDRIFHYAVLQMKSSGRKILVVNTHLHYGGTGSGHEEDDKVRRYEIRTLLAWLETQKATYPDQIVLGDMNSHYKGSGQGAVNMKVFTDGGFNLSRLTAKITGDVGGTYAKPKRTAQDQWIFDYILTKGSFGTAYYTVVNNPIDTDNTYPSDHIPILAQLYFK